MAYRRDVPQRPVLREGGLGVGLLRGGLHWRHWLSPSQSRFGSRLGGNYYVTGLASCQVLDPLSVEITSLICTSHFAADLNRQAACDEKAKTGEGVLGGDPGVPLQRVLYLQ